MSNELKEKFEQIAKDVRGYKSAISKEMLLNAIQLAYELALNDADIDGLKNKNDGKV